jgi:hypothetical protein
VKSIRTRQHHSIALLKRNSTIGFSETPIWNRILDLYGYFSLLEYVDWRYRMGEAYRLGGGPSRSEGPKKW